MGNFLKFIEEDIETKRTLFSTLPINNKRNKRTFNEKLEEVYKKYDSYKADLKKYLIAKSNRFNVKVDKSDIEKLTNEINELERVRFILNPINTFYEKMGFGNLMFEISNYNDLNFNLVNEIIDKFLDKFELASLKIDSTNFNYTCYVNEYMSAFLENKRKNNKSYDSLSEIFEKIYWINPELIQHIQLNFRQIIKKNERQFINYISKLQNETLSKKNIRNYEDCLEKLKVLYTKFNSIDKESISDIIEFAINGTIDINNFFENSKFRNTAYTSLIIEPFESKDSSLMENFYDELEKLKTNVEEYENYITFEPMLSYFKTEYSKITEGNNKEQSKATILKNIKTIESKISQQESKLEKLNKKILKGGSFFFEQKNVNDDKKSKIESLKYAEEIYNLYSDLDKEYFKEKILNILNESLTIYEFLKFFYSFDYFKKKAIKSVFKATNYSDILSYSDKFDLFAMNPYNVIIKGLLIFDDVDLVKMIVNKYRLNNINLLDENLSSDELQTLIEKIKFLLRVREIENSSITVEKIWFMVQVEKIKKNEQE